MAQPAPSIRRLKLLARDSDDLQVISAALQDAVARVGDIAVDLDAKHLTVALNRFRWEAAKGRGGERIRSGLQFGGVLKVQARRLRRDAPEAVVSLMAVEFEPDPDGDENPGGTVILRFSGDADLRLDVECLDACLADVSDPWPTPRQPRHAHEDG